MSNLNYKHEVYLLDKANKYTKNRQNLLVLKCNREQNKIFINDSSVLLDSVFLSDYTKDSGSGFVILIDNTPFIYIEQHNYLKDFEALLGDFKAFLDSFKGSLGTTLVDGVPTPLSTNSSLTNSAEVLQQKIDKLIESLP